MGSFYHSLPRKQQGIWKQKEKACIQAKRMDTGFDDAWEKNLLDAEISAWSDGNKREKCLES